MKPLPKNPDRRKTYYKITNKEESHYGLQYHDGLVVDFRTFNDNPESSCVAGGIYFTTSEYILKFFHYGTWIRPLKIPKNARVILDPNGDKYRADMVFMYKRMPLVQYIKKIFNPNGFNWEENSDMLATILSDDFDKWWDAERFNWEHSYALAHFCCKHFDKWWNAEKFNWGIGSLYLAMFCSSHFDKWWNSEKFNWGYSLFLAKYCDSHFTKWWDDKKYNWLCSDYLAIYCNDSFNKWWNPEKFNWKYANYLFEYCSKYKDIWLPESPSKILEEYREMKNVKSEKLILENLTDLPMETFLRFALEVVKMGRVSNNDRQYCWVTTFNIDGKTYVVSSKLNKKSDKLTLYEYNLLS